jgi:hypothetical protein
MPKVEGLDTDGKLVVSVHPDQVNIGEDGRISISNEELRKFVSDRSSTMAPDLHLILMGSDCGCKCCC